MKDRNIKIIVSIFLMVMLAWNANTESDLAGYKIHYGTSNYSTIIDVGNFTVATIDGLSQGQTYHFVATAYNTSGLESGYSNEISYTVPVVKKGRGNRK